jgi:hypothetical protein
VNLILAVIGAQNGLTVGWIVGSAISTLGSKLPLFLSLAFSVVDDRSAAVGCIICMPLICFPARVQDAGEDMEHVLFWNLLVCSPQPTWLIDRNEWQKLGVRKDLT